MSLFRRRPRRWRPGDGPTAEDYAMVRRLGPAYEVQRLPPVSSMGPTAALAARPNGRDPMAEALLTGQSRGEARPVWPAKKTPWNEEKDDADA